MWIEYRPGKGPGIVKSLVRLIGGVEYRFSEHRKYAGLVCDLPEPLAIPLLNMAPGESNHYRKAELKPVTAGDGGKGESAGDPPGDPEVKGPAEKGKKK